MNILIFKTDLENPERINRVKPLLQNTNGIHKWNVDMHDCDNVLRIESGNLSAREIENLLQQAGYYCEELTD